LAGGGRVDSKVYHKSSRTQAKPLYQLLVRSRKPKKKTLEA
ncbi:hypothetical protein T11_15754, partial [Trichinella zimbabwensis]